MSRLSVTFLALCFLCLHRGISEEVKILKGIFKDYIGPYLQRKFVGSMGPINMTQEEASQKADDDFPPAQGEDFNAEDYK